jgi:putative ABC transport system permease protein
MGDAMPEDRSDTIMFNCNYIDSKYLKMHGFELLAGTGFLTPLEDEEIQNSIIVNEGFLKALELGSPEEAIGKQIWYFDEVKLKIQGVVKDFVSKSLDAESPGAFGFLNGGMDENKILGVKIASNDLLTTLAKLEKSYKELDSVHPFEATFYDDQIANTYQDSKTTYTLISFLAFLAITISSLGLLGMAIFTIETRMKEISVRKVLGAEIMNLILLLSRSFLVMMAIAAAIAIPVTRYIVDVVILKNFLYRTEIGFIETLSGLVIVLLIGGLTVGWQVRRAAVQNPADILRDE